MLFNWNSLSEKYERFTGKDCENFVGTAGFSSKFPNVTLDINIAVNPAQRFEVYDWCETQFRNNWIYDQDPFRPHVFYFINEKDAMLFALRWM